MPPTIQFNDGPSTAVLVLSGRIVAEDDCLLRERIEQTLRSPAPIKAIDCTDVEFLDSYALGQIIYCCTNPQGKRGGIYFVNRSNGGSSYIDRLVEIADLRQIFTIVDSIETLAADDNPEN
ncbi:MAG: STAS domain-containing protein [Fibrobacter sp.]|nr:STAS domain-containing protein [Fibrobacter sp.]